MQVMIASLEFAAKGRGVLKFFCHLEAASISFGTSAMVTCSKWTVLCDAERKHQAARRRSSVDLGIVLAPKTTACSGTAAFQQTIVCVPNDHSSSKCPSAVGGSLEGG